MKLEKYRDPVHGYIFVKPYESEIINSKPFQRLRNIKQLALTHLVFHGAEHTRFGHSIGVMHIVTKAFNSVINKNKDFFPTAKIDWYEQILRLIALTHDLGHAPFSHASESMFPDGLEHEAYTEMIIKETCIADIINKIGDIFVKRYGEEYRITPELICDIYAGRNPGNNSEFVFLKSFMDSELDCDKMDYLLRDSLFCGVNYGKYDIDRLITCLTIYVQDGMPRLAIKTGGIQAFEEFVLARYFMFVQVYFHRTRRYFDIMLAEALKDILPNGKYPSNINKYLEWDDCKVLQIMKEKSINFEKCSNIINRVVYPTVLETGAHPNQGDSKLQKLIAHHLFDKLGKDLFIEDYSAGKMPHKIPKKTEVDDEGAIIIVNDKLDYPSTISYESHIINSLTEKINIERIYVKPEKREDALSIVKSEYDKIK